MPKMQYTGKKTYQGADQYSNASLTVLPGQVVEVASHIKCAELLATKLWEHVGPDDHKLKADELKLIEAAATDADIKPESSKKVPVVSRARGPNESEAVWLNRIGGETDAEVAVRLGRAETAAEKHDRLKSLVDNKK